MTRRKILQAIEAAPRVAAALGLRAGQVCAVEFQPDNRAVVFIDASDTQRRTTVLAEGLVALLVAYCARIRVPLPRHGQKAIDVMEGSVTLRIVVEQAGGGKESAQLDYPGAMVWPRRLHLRSG